MEGGKLKKEWWESDDRVTLITRPRRFGKTLNMSMLECFFSVQYEGRGDIFQNLSIWEEEKYRELQGTYPVIFLSFADVKADNYTDAKKEILLIIEELYRKYAFIKKSEILEEKERNLFDGVGKDMDYSSAVRSIHQLAEYMYRYYGKKVIILLDEYDTPLQEAYVKGNRNTKMQFELLLSGKTIQSRIDEEMVFNRLEENEDAVWSLLLASGYLKNVGECGEKYELSLTNYEVKQTFESMVRDWFGKNASDYNDFIKALLAGDTEAMNEYMTEVAESMFSSFDGGDKPSARTAPERFYHGFVLGLLVDLAGRYVVSSNRESGFGRYDVMLKPLNRDDDGIILEFKIYNPKKESSLEETVQAALDQIEEKNYEQTLLDEGIERNRIRKYGFAFRGKEVLIG